MICQHVNMHGEYDFNLETTQMPFNLSKSKYLVTS